jgi:hypothetical protein
MSESSRTVRSSLALVVLLGLPSGVAAQSSWTSTSSGLAPLGLPLPPIGLPLAPIGLPPASSEQAPGGDASRPAESGRGRHEGRRGRGDRVKRHVGSSVVYVGAPYWWGYEPPQTTSVPGTIVYEPAPEPPQPALGRLRLDVEPADAAQVFVDGEFVGTLSEVGGELELEQGSRHIELQAAGFEPLVLNARIAAGRTITYQGALESSEPDNNARAGTPLPDASPMNRTLYFVPGCYLGNVHPRDVTLPEDCDLSRLITWTP